jgi:predicted ABC-class ATPase
MIRDDKMMQLVAPDKEPITPFVRIVRSLYDDMGISTILVVGGVGDYFDVADNVVIMDAYRCHDATERAKQIVADSKSQMPHTASAGVPFRPIRPRTLNGMQFAANGKVKVASQSTISYGETELDISGLEQLVSKAQTAAIANALQRIPSISQGVP